MTEAQQLLEKVRAEKKANLKKSKYHHPNPPGEPYWWQNIQTLHIIVRKTHFVGDLTGLGKTPEILHAYAILKERNPDLKMWVIGSKSATTTWEDEIPKWTTGIKYIRTPSERVALSLLPKAERAKWRGLSSTAFRNHYAYAPWKDHGDILITNYEQAQRDWETIVVGLKKENVMLVADEASHFSHEETKLYEAVVKLREYADRFYPLSATIAKNGLREARGILSVMDPSICPPAVFESYFCVYKKQWVKNGKKGSGYKANVLAGYKNIEEFKKIVDPWYLGYRDDDPEIAKYLPELENKVIRVDIPQEMKEIYGAIEDRVIDPEWGKELTPLTKLMYVQFFINAPILLKDKFPAVKDQILKCAQDMPPKLKVLIDLMETELKGEQMLVYSHWETSVTVIYETLKEKGYKVGRITGKEEDEERAAARDALKSGKIQILVIDDAGGESLNMQSAKGLIAYDLPWSPGDYTQLVGRVRRLNGGQMKLVYHLMVPESIDTYKWGVLDRKYSILEKLYKGRGTLLTERRDERDSVQMTVAGEVMEEMRRRRGKHGNPHTGPKDESVG